MDFFRVVRQRRSIRAFQDKPVEQDKLQRLLETLNQAPSAGNLQAYEVYLVRGGAAKAVLAQAVGSQPFLAQAPISLVFCTHGSRAETRYRERGTTLYTVQDATIACTYAMLAATALGLASVWVGAFDEQLVGEAVGVPAGQRAVAILPVGYAAESPPTPVRRSLEDLVHPVG